LGAGAFLVPHGVAHAPAFHLNVRDLAVGHMIATLESTRKVEPVSTPANPDSLVLSLGITPNATKKAHARPARPPISRPSTTLDAKVEVQTSRFFLTTPRRALSEVP
jgi:hypothetical protein